MKAGQFPVGLAGWVRAGEAAATGARRWLCIVLLAGMGALAPLPGLAAEITVFAAASLKTALDQIAADWQARTGDGVAISYGGSSALAKQIEQGAPADIYISAAVNWMDHLEAAGLIRPGTRRDLVGNTLVLVANGAAAPVVIGSDLDLGGMIGDGKLAMGLVESVPAGQYGKAALTALGLWDQAQASVVQSENVRAALALVALGEAAYGIVYASDAVADAGAGGAVTVIGIFPGDSHPPIRYPAALVASSQTPGAQALLDHLSTPGAQAVFAAQGFTLLP